MVTFAKYILSKFFSTMTTKPSVVIDLLYWKNATECIEIKGGKEALLSLYVYVVMLVPLIILIALRILVASHV